MAGPDIYWRSSPPGVDLLAFVMPNPNSPWFGSERQGMDRGAARRRVRRTDGGPAAGRLAVIAVAWVWAGWRPHAPALALDAGDVRRARARAVRARGGHQHLHPRAVGAAPLRARSSASPVRRLGSCVLVSLGVALLFAHGPGRASANAGRNGGASCSGLVTALLLPRAVTGAAATLRGHDPGASSIASPQIRAPTCACCRCPSACATAPRRSATSTR